MPYIHEQLGWPELEWDSERIAKPLAEVRYKQGMLIGRMGELGFELKAKATLETLTEDVLKSSEIEGERLDKEQVRSSIARRLGMDIGAITPADRDVEGVVEMMLDATQNYDKPLTRERLFDWHASLFPTGRSGMGRITLGAWRTDESGPMQVVSGPIGRERVHYEAPEAARLDKEMAAFIDWFNDEQIAIDPLLKAGVAHLWFVTIHPFDDGNGRIARAIADMALARSEKSAQRFYSMSAQIRIERRAYYDFLEATQRGDLDISYWLLWFLACLERALDNADDILSGVLEKGRFWERLAGEAFNDRQRKVLNRLLDGFEGKLTSSKWAAITKASQDTASRDIDDLIRRHILVKQPAGGRSTSYALITGPTDALLAVANYTRAFSSIFVRDGARMLSEEESVQRKASIEALAGEIETLAREEKDQTVMQKRFEEILAPLATLGFYPEQQLVSTARHAFHRARRS